MTLLSLLLALCGCKRTPTPARPPAGPNLQLRYPVIIFSRPTSTIDVRNDAKSLTTTMILQQTIFEGMQIVDSAYTLYDVLETQPAEKVPNYFQDSVGNKPYRISMRLQRVRTVDLGETKRLLLTVVQDPQSDWSESLDGNAKAIKTVQGLRSFGEMVTACRHSSIW
jgi:hypothetical protein